MPAPRLQRNFLQRLFGIPATRPPRDPRCWRVEDGEVVIDLERATELAQPGGAIRLEGDPLPERVLVYRGDDDQLHACCNRCTHGGRRLDPDPGNGRVQCCSVGRSSFDYDGKLVSGSAREPGHAYPVRADNGKLFIVLDR